MLPAFNSRITANRQGTNTPRSGHHSDQLVEFLDALWIDECIRTKKVKDAVDVEKPSAKEQQEGGELSSGNERQSPARERGGGTKESDGAKEANTDTDETDGMGQSGGREESPTDTAQPAPGANPDKARVVAAGDELGPEPDKGSLDHEAWMARCAIHARAQNETASSRAATGYPDRPIHWMHYLTLAFCFFGRPSGENEETDLRLCNEGSGPKGDRSLKVKKEKKTGRESSDGSDSIDSMSGPSYPLSAAAMKNLVGAGKSQSRVKAKKKAAKIAAVTSAYAMKKEWMVLAREQTKVSKGVAEAMQQIATDVHIQRQLGEENACRKRKQGAIGDLRMELEFADQARAPAIRTMIGKVCRKHVSDFTADFTVDDMDTDAPPAAATTASISTPSVFTPV